MNNIEYIQPPRSKQPFVRVPKRTEPVALFVSQILDRALGMPDYVEVAIIDDNGKKRIALQKAEKGAPNSIRVRRYQYGSNTAITRIPGLDLRSKFLQYGYKEGERIYMIERTPGLWVEM